MYAPAGVTPTTTSGGRALPFYASQRVQVNMGDKIQEKGEVVGHLVKIKVIKNKIAVPFKEASFPLIYGQGVDIVDEISQVAVLAGFVVQAGAWFRIMDPETGELRSHNGRELKFQGRAALTEYLRENEDLRMELEARIRGVEVEMPDGEAVEDHGYGDHETDTVA